MGVELKDHKDGTHDVGGEAMKRPDTPFPRHWLYYIALKFVVLGAALALVSNIMISGEAADALPTGQAGER